MVAQVKSPQGTTDAVTLAPVPGSAGSYQGTFEPKRPGTYEIVVEARLGETVLKAEKTTAEVGRPNLEFDRLDLDDAMLAADRRGHRRALFPYQHGRPVARRARPQGEAAARLARAAALLPPAVLVPVRGRPGDRVGPPQEVSTAMSRDRGYRYLDPAALARVKNLSLVARGVVEGFITRAPLQPLQGVQRRVRRAPQVQPRRQHPPPRLADPGPHRPALHQAIRGRDQPPRPDPAGHERLDGLRRASRRSPSSQYASYLTAVLAYLMMRQQDAVGLTSFDTEVRLDMPARSSPRHFDEMMNHLEAIEPGRTTNLGATLHRLADRFKRRCLIVLISDLYDDPEAVDRALHHFRHKRHEVIVFHVLDRAEIEFPFRDTASFIDMETGERIQVDPAYVRDDYRRQLEEFIARYRRICADCQFDYVLTDTSVPFDYMLSRYLEKRTRP